MYSAAGTSDPRLLAEVGHGLADRLGCLGGRVGSLDRLLPRPERLDLPLQALAGGGQLLFLPGQAEILPAQAGELFHDRRRPACGDAGQIVAARPLRLIALAGEAVCLLLQRADLQLEALARGCHVGDTAADLRQGFELALVGAVQGLPGILRLPEHRLQRDDQGRPKGIPRVDQRQHRLADEAGLPGFGLPEVGEPSADLAVQPELVAHDRNPRAPRLVPTGTVPSGIAVRQGRPGKGAATGSRLPLMAITETFPRHLGSARGFVSGGHS